MKIMFVLCLLSLSFSQDFDYSNMSEAEKIMIYNSMKGGTTSLALEMIVPTLGYAQIDKFGRGAIFRGVAVAGGFVAYGLATSGCGSSLYDFENTASCWETKGTRAALSAFYLISFIGIIDLNNQISKYNNNLYKQIFGKESPKIGFNLYPLQDGAGISLTYSIN